MSGPPCPEGFHFIGQPLSSCDRCGLPAWEHAGIAEPARPLESPFDDVVLALRPWRAGEREAVQRRWAGHA